jgi:hypothetical protein
MSFSILEIFLEKLNEVETRCCSACNYTQQSQKGHTCWNGYRHVTNEDQYGYAFVALEELEDLKIFTNNDVSFIEKFLKNKI